MIPFFLSLIFAFGAPVHISTAHVAVSTVSPKVENNSFSVLQTQDPEPLQEGEEESYKPYTGFNILAFGMIIVTLLVIGFVIIKVFKRMNKSRRYEGENKQGGRGKTD